MGFSGSYTSWPLKPNAVTPFVATDYTQVELSRLSHENTSAGWLYTWISSICRLFWHEPHICQQNLSHDPVKLNNDPICKIEYLEEDLFSSWSFPSKARLLEEPVLPPKNILHSETWNKTFGTPTRFQGGPPIPVISRVYRGYNPGYPFIRPFFSGL